MIKYQGTVCKISISGEVSNVVTIDIKEITRQVHEVTEATNHAKLLDDYQFLLCKEMDQWSQDNKYVKLIRGFRIVITAYIIRLADIMEQIKIDPTNVEIKHELNNISTKMNRLIDKLEKSVLGDSVDNQ